jgi:hypothetical protein
MRQLTAGGRPLLANGQYLMVPDAVVSGGTLSPDTLSLTKTAGGGFDLFKFAGDQPFTLSDYVLISGPAPAALEVSLNAGAYLSIADFNTALDAADRTELAAGFSFTFRLTAATTAALSVEITATYHG